MDPSSLDTLSSATPLFSGLIDSADMTVVLVQTLGRNIDGRMCCTGVTLSAPSAPSVSVTVDEAKALVEDKFEDQPTTLLALRDELSNVPILSSGCFGSLQSALTPPSCKVLAECLLPKMLDLLEEETLEEETPIDEADLSRQLSPLYDVSEIYMAAVDRIMKAAQPSPRATSPLFGHPDLIGVYGSAINRGAFKQPLADSQTPRAQSPYMDHPALSGVYTSAIDRGAFKQSAAEARLKGEAATPRSPRATSPLRHHPALNGAYDSAIAHGAFKSEADAQSPRATSPLLGHSGLTGVYDSAMQRGAFKERKPEAPQILRIKYESEEEAQPSPRSMSPLRNHPALDGVYAAALNRGAFKQSAAEARLKGEAATPRSPRATSPLRDHPALNGVYDSALQRGAFKPLKPEAPQILRIKHESEEEAQPSPRATSPLVGHPGLSGVYTSAINRGAFKQSTAEVRGESIHKVEAPQILRIKHESEEEAQPSPRATSPLVGHPGLSGVYTSAINRGAFKQSTAEVRAESIHKVEAPQILRIKHESEEEAQPSPRCMSPLRNHPALDGVYAAALNRGAFKGIKPHLSPRTTSPLIDHPALAGVYDSAIDRGAFRNVTPEKAAEAFDNDNTTKSTEDKADFGNLLHHAADSAAAVLIVQRMLRGYASRRKVHAKRAREWAVYVGLADSAQSRRHFRWVGRNGTFMALSRYKSDGTYDLCTIDMATGQLSVASDPENNDLNVPRQVIVGDVVDQSGGGLVGAPSTAPDEILVTASGHHTERAVLDDGSILRDFADGWQEQRCSDGTLTIQGAAGVMQVTDDRTLILHPSGSATDSYPETIQVDNDDTILISFEDGTNRQFMPDGSRTTQLPDGTVEQVNVSGVKITQYPDGQQMQTELDGTTLVRGTDGSITQTSQDGTITRKMLNGTRHKVLPDKSEIWYYTDGTRMEVSAPPEKTIRRFAVTGEEVLEE